MRYISILRGINVSGKRKILMADLRALYERLGFSNVVTYIQSGNVAFDAKPAENNNILAQQIADAIQTQYDFDVPILVRTKAEIDTAIVSNPFLTKEGIDVSKLHITFLATMPEEAYLEKLKEVNYAPDEFQIIGQNIFIHCEKYGRTKLTNTFFERKLKVAATTRNWKTVNKLAEMAAE